VTQMYGDWLNACHVKHQHVNKVYILTLQTWIDSIYLSPLSWVGFLALQIVVGDFILSHLMA